MTAKKILSMDAHETNPPRFQRTALGKVSLQSASSSKVWREFTLEKQTSSTTPVEKYYKEGQYEDFETIDWVKDLARDRIRHRLIHSSKHSFCDHLRAHWDSGSGWFCVLLIGIITGVIAGVVDIGSQWLSDIRYGICWDALWFSKEQCCWSIDEEQCHWYTWSVLLTNKDSSSDSLSFFINYVFYLMWAILFAGLCVLLVKSFAPYACGSGIPEIKTILSGFIIHGYLGKWTLLIKSVGMILGVSAGLSLGKEGPMVHMAACCGNIISYLFPKYGKNEAKKREILSASAAAGVAVAFGAPIGGVLFSLEEASYYFPMKTMFRSFFCAMISANMLRMMNPNGNEHLVMFYVDYKAQWHIAELIPFAFLGMLGGIFGTMFNKANLFICRLRKSTWLGHHPIREVVLVTAITAIVSYPHEYLRINTGELIKLLVSRCLAPSLDDFSICDYNTTNLTDAKYQVIGSYPAGPLMPKAIALLVVGVILKGLITVFTFGIKVPTGLFIPSLAVGAMMGRVVGVTMEQLVVKYADHHLVQHMCKTSGPCINPGLYAMVGAAASLGGVTRMTISLVVVMLELTGGLNYIIPLMVAAMVSKWMGDWLTNGSIYEEHIRLNNYPYLSSHDELSHDLVARDVMTPRLRTNDRLLVLTEVGMTIEDVQKVVNNSNVKGYPVVVSQESCNLIGWVTRRDLIHALEKERSFDPRITSKSLVSFASILGDNEISDSRLICEPDEATFHSINLPNQTNQFVNDEPDDITIQLRQIVDLSPITVTDQTSMETVLDFFRKLGLRQILVTQNGRLHGIITKKDILSKILEKSTK